MIRHKVSDDRFSLRDPDSDDRTEFLEMKLVVARREICDLLCPGR